MPRATTLSTPNTPTRASKSRQARKETNPTCPSPVEFSSDERDHWPADIQRAIVAFDPKPFLELRVLAETFWDTQANRIACVNRMERGGVPPELFVAQIEALEASEHVVELALVRAYRRTVLGQLPAVREWQVGSFGIGEKLLARLLGALGHPRIATPFHWEGTGSDRVLVADVPFERTISQLWAYCGHGDPARKKARGMSAEDAFALGNPKLKMLVHLLAEATMKTKPATAVPNPTSEAPATFLANPTQDPPATLEPTITQPKPNQKPSAAFSPDQIGSADHYASVGESLAPPREKTKPTDRSPIRSYRTVYDLRRAATAERLHASDCVRCGPSGKPALAGSPWSKAHQHADALRIVGKEILRDLWLLS